MTEEIETDGAGAVQESGSGPRRSRRFEIPELVSDSLAEYGIVCGRGNIRGEMGPRNAVATGLALSYIGGGSYLDFDIPTDLASARSAAPSADEGGATEADSNGPDGATRGTSTSENGGGGDR